MLGVSGLVQAVCVPHYRLPLERLVWQVDAAVVAWRMDTAVVCLDLACTCGGMGKWRFLVENVGFYVYLEVDTAVV